MRLSFEVLQKRVCAVKISIKIRASSCEPVFERMPETTKRCSLITSVSLILICKASALFEPTKRLFGENGDFPLITHHFLSFSSSEKRTPAIRTFLAFRLTVSKSLGEMIDKFFRFFMVLIFCKSFSESCELLNETSPRLKPP